MTDAILEVVVENLESARAAQAGGCR